MTEQCDRAAPICLAPANQGTGARQGIPRFIAKNGHTRLAMLRELYEQTGNGYTRLAMLYELYEQTGKVKHDDD